MSQLRYRRLFFLCFAGAMILMCVAFKWRHLALVVGAMLLLSLGFGLNAFSGLRTGSMLSRGGLAENNIAGNRFSFYATLVLNILFSLGGLVSALVLAFG